jgi:hypothetical protein
MWRIKSMKTQLAGVAAIALGFLAFWGPTFARTVDLAAAAQAQNEHPLQTPAAQASTTEPASPDSMHGRMMADHMKAADAKLQDLVKKMHEATGPAKTDAIAAVVTELVEQHRAMRGMMAGRMDSTKGMMNRPDK